jgi:GNAT superfamily N-acetyltransferase
MGDPARCREDTVMPNERTLPSGLIISDELARFDVAAGHRWLSQESYWAEGIPFAVFERALRNSLPVGVYTASGDMAAMARVVTDRATFAWIDDVFVDRARRGAGLGKAMMAYIMAHPDLQRLRRLHLATRDAHGLYAQFGFVAFTGAASWMEVSDPHVYRRVS